MKNRIMLGLWKYMLNVPTFLLDPKKQLMREKMRFEAAMGFMTEDHRRVHHFAVKELPHVKQPLSPDLIAQKLDLSRDRGQDAPSPDVQLRRAGLRGLSSGRVCHALRARAPAERAAYGRGPDRMRTLQNSDGADDRQRSELHGQGKRLRAHDLYARCGPLGS